MHADKMMLMMMKNWLKANLLRPYIMQSSNLSTIPYCKINKNRKSLPSIPNAFPCAVDYSWGGGGGGVEPFYTDLK